MRGAICVRGNCSFILMSVLHRDSCCSLSFQFVYLFCVLFVCLLLGLFVVVCFLNQNLTWYFMLSFAAGFYQRGSTTLQSRVTLISTAWAARPWFPQSLSLLVCVCVCGGGGGGGTCAVTTVARSTRSETQIDDGASEAFEKDCG